jgi:hypothetical protein
MKIHEIAAAQKAFFDTGKTLDLKFRMDALRALLSASPGTKASCWKRCTRISANRPAKGI